MVVGNNSPQTSDTRSVAHFSPTDAHDLGISLEEGEHHNSDEASSITQDDIRPYEHGQSPPPRRRRGRKSHIHQLINSSSRVLEPKFASKLSKMLATVPGGPGSNRGIRGQVRHNESGILEFFEENRETWSRSSAIFRRCGNRPRLIQLLVPAIYHHEIRAKLIIKAKNGQNDTYRKPFPNPLSTGKWLTAQDTLAPREMTS